MKEKINLHSPAGNLACLKVAVDNGADVVYLGFQSASNLRNFAGLNFSRNSAAEGIEYAHQYGKKVYLTVNSYPQVDELAVCFKAIDDAFLLGADAVIVSDLAVLEYTRRNYPNLPIHLSVQAGASNPQSIRFYQEQFGIVFVCLPRVLTIDELTEICASTDVGIEVFVMGSVCINYEGKCHFSPYITGESTNTIGTCSSPRFLTFEDEKTLLFRMNGIALNEYYPSELPSPPRIYQGRYQERNTQTQWVDSFLINRRQICKGRYFNEASKSFDYAFNSVVWLNTLGILDKLIEAGASAFKIEGRQRSPEYVARATRIFRQAIDAYCREPGNYRLLDEWMAELGKLFEELQPSTTCYLGK